MIEVRSRFSVLTLTTSVSVNGAEIFKTLQKVGHNEPLCGHTFLKGRFEREPSVTWPLDKLAEELSPDPLKGFVLAAEVEEIHRLNYAAVRASNYRSPGSWRWINETLEKFDRVIGT